MILRTLISLTILTIVIVLVTAPFGCSKTGTTTAPSGSVAEPVIDPENSKGGVDRVKHIET